MKGPDQIFNSVKNYLPPPCRAAVRPAFRRLIREYHIHASSRVYCSATGCRIDKKKNGAAYRYTGNRLRKINKFPKRPSRVGRPAKVALQGLVHRLGGLWAIYVKKRTTISTRRVKQSPTAWELFVKGTLAGLGHFNYRKYVELHSRLVKPRISTDVRS